MHGVDIGRPSPIRTRDRPAASRGGGVCCDRDAIHGLGWSIWAALRSLAVAVLQSAG